MVILLAIREDADRHCINKGICDNLEQACILLAILERNMGWPEGFEALVVDTTTGKNQFIV